MVSCKDVGARLGSFLRGELSFPDRFAIHRHLAHCPNCARLVEEGRDALNVSKSALTRAADPVADEVPEQLVRAILVTCRGAHRA
jgi:anti-sigma factor RsiW